MNGMISFADAPAFHALVDRRDYRIVCVFEVFSQNRSEDDFLENLALIAQIIKEQEHASKTQVDEHRAVSEAVEEDPFVVFLQELVQDNLISREQADWVKAQRAEKFINSVYNTYLKTNDKQDCADSLLRLHKKHMKTAPVVVVSETSETRPPPITVKQDPLIVELTRLVEEKKLTGQLLAVGRQLREQEDKKLSGIYNCYLRQQDRDDFVDSVRNYLQRQAKK